MPKVLLVLHVPKTREHKNCPRIKLKHETLGGGRMGSYLCDVPIFTCDGGVCHEGLPGIFTKDVLGSSIFFS